MQVVLPQLDGSIVGLGCQHSLNHWRPPLKVIWRAIVQPS